MLLRNMSGGKPRYTLTPYKCITLPLFTDKKTINNKWTNDVLPMVVLDSKRTNISVAECNANPKCEEIEARVFEPPASLTAPCFYDEKTRKKYVERLPKNGFKGFWSFCGHDGGNLSQLCFLMKDYKLVSSARKDLPKITYARSAAKITGIGMQKDLDVVRATVKNVLNCNPKKYMRKDNLSNILAGKGILADTYDMDDFLERNLKGIWIAKPADGFGGIGIVVSDNIADFQAIKTAEQAKPAGAWKMKYIICKYIENPLLFHGKKMHIRVHFIIGKRAEIVNEFSVFPIVDIITAKKPYVLSDFGNADIHDSHRSSTEIFTAYNNNYFMVEGELVQHDTRFQDGEQPTLTLIDDTWDVLKIRESIYQVMDIVKTSVDYDRFVKYEDSENAYRVYAADVMLDTTYAPYLLEINAMPGKKSFQEYRNYNRQILNWEMNAFVFPIIKNIRLVRNDLLEGDKKIGSFSFAEKDGKTWLSITVITPGIGHGSTLLHRLENARYAELKACYAKVSKTNHTAIKFFQKYFSLLEKGNEYIFKY